MIGVTGVRVCDCEGSRLASVLCEMVDVIKQEVRDLEPHRVYTMRALVDEDRLYRVSAHLASEDEADGLCAAIKKNSGDCVVWPGTPLTLTSQVYNLR